MKKLLLFSILLLTCTLSAKKCDLCDQTSAGGNGTNLHSVTFSKNGNCLIAASWVKVSSYAVDNCEIITPPISTIDVLDGLNASAVLSPNSQCLVTLAQRPGPDRIEIFSFDPQTCSITQPAKQTVNVNLGLNLSIPQPKKLSISPDGNFLAVARLSGSEILIYAFDEEQCMMSTEPIQTLNTGENSPLALQFSPKCQLLAVTLENTTTQEGKIALYKLNPVTEQFEQTQPPISSGGNSPVALDFSRKDHCLAISNNDSRTIATFCVNKALGTLGSATILNTNLPPAGISFSPDRRCLAVGNSELMLEGTIDIYTLCHHSCVPKFLETLSVGEGVLGRSTADVTYGPCTCFAVAISEGGIDGTAAVLDTICA